LFEVFRVLKQIKMMDLQLSLASQP